MERDATTPNNDDSSLSAEGLKRAVRGGTLATVLAQIVAQLISIAQLAFLYRLIDPAGFGLFGMVLPLVMFLRLFTTLGLNVATVGRQEISDEQVSALFWLNMALGAATALATAALAPVVVWFYSLSGALPAGEDRQLLWLAMALGGTAFVAALSAQHQALMERHLRLARLNGIRVVAQLSGGMSGITAASLGAGLWALVVQQYVELTMLGAAAWIVEPWRPSRPGTRASLAELLRFGGHYTASSVVFFLSTNLDKVLVGMMLGPRALAFYSQAFNLAMKPVLVASSTITGVMLPALSRSQHDPGTYRELVVAFYRLVAIVLMPAGVGLAIVGPEAMLALGGEPWAPAGDVLRVFALLVLAQGFINIAGSVFASIGRADRLLAAAAVLTFVTLQGVFAGWFFWTIFGHTQSIEPVLYVAAGYAISLAAVVLVPYMSFCFSTVGLSLSDWWSAIRRPLVAACMMGAVVASLRVALVRTFKLPPEALLGIELGIGGVVYLALARGELRWIASQWRRG